MDPLARHAYRQAIALATAVAVPAMWLLLAGLVAIAADDRTEGPLPAVAIACGLALVPVAFVVLARVSAHPGGRRAVLKAVGMFVLVGIPVSAAAADAVTGLVAAVGAGGMFALRPDEADNGRARVLAIAAASVYTFVLVRIAGPIVLVSAPVFPFTALGAADYLSARRRDREAVYTQA